MAKQYYDFTVTHRGKVPNIYRVHGDNVVDALFNVGADIGEIVSVYRIEAGDRSTKIEITEDMVDRFERAKSRCAAWGSARMMVGIAWVRYSLMGQYMFDLDGDQKIIAVVDPSRPCYHIPNGFACTYDDDTVAILDLCNVGYLVLE